MGRLAGFSYLDVTRKLKLLGFSKYRQGKGDHELWADSYERIKVSIPKHKEIKEGTLRSILKQARIDVDVFLDT